MIVFSLVDHPPASTCRLKLRSMTLRIVHTAVEAPGEAPSIAAMEPSDENTSSVPNCKMPPCVGSFLMIWTRCPARSGRQLVGLALGKKRCRCSKRSSDDSSLDFRHQAVASKSLAQEGVEFCVASPGNGGSEKYRRHDSWRTAVSMSRKDGVVLERYQGRASQPVASPCWSRAAYQRRTRS